jgi:hypothetical protein
MELDPNDDCTLQRIRNFLAPRQLWITRLQEIFFFRRKSVLHVAFPTIYLTSFFIYTKDLGLYSTIFLFALILYVTCVLYCYADDWFVQFLFPPDVQEPGPNAPNRTRSVDEVSIILLDWWKYAKGLHARVTLTRKNRLWIAGSAILAAAIFTKIRTFWINFILLNLVIFTPGAMNAPAAQYTAKRKESSAEPLRADSEPK